MIQNNNLCPLAWYDSLSKQNHRKTYSNGEVVPLVFPSGRILPFQFVADEIGAFTFTAVNLVNLANGSIIDIKDQLINRGLVKAAFTAYSVIKYLGVLPFAVNFSEGNHYLELTTSTGNTYYSEVFSFSNLTSDCLKIKYWDNDNWVYNDYGRIIYESFKFELFLQTQLGYPEYTFEEEGEDNNGQFLIERQLSEKTYKFTFLAPEYLVDALRTIWHADNVIISSLGNEYRAESISFKTTWQDGGYLCKVEAEMQTNKVFKKTGTNYQPISDGDFNNDFNNDFNI